MKAQGVQRPAELEELRESWSMGAELFAVHLAAHGEVNVLRRELPGELNESNYIVVRYFQTGGRWNASVDYNGPEQKQAFIKFSEAVGLVS